MYEAYRIIDNIRFAISFASASVVTLFIIILQSLERVISALSLLKMSKCGVDTRGLYCLD